MRDLEQSAHLKNKNPDVQISFKDYLEPCVIYTDRNRLSQLMINLLNNAMKFTQAGSILFGYKLKDDNTLWFYVEDTGCGIPERYFRTFCETEHFRSRNRIGFKYL